MSALVERALATYRYEYAPGLVGEPLPEAKIARELTALRAALVPPRQAKVHVSNYTGELLRTSEAWVVAESADGAVVVYEPASRDFWLVEGEERVGYRTFGVNGDLVGTFMAR